MWGVQLCLGLLSLCGLFSSCSSEHRPNSQVLRVKPGADVTLHCPLVDALSPTPSAPESLRSAPDQSSPLPVRVLTWYRWSPGGSPQMVLSLDLAPRFRFEYRSGPGSGPTFERGSGQGSRPESEPGSGLESNEDPSLEPVLTSGPGSEPMSDPRSKPESEPGSGLESNEDPSLEPVLTSGPESEPTSDPRSKPESEPGSGLDYDEVPPRSGFRSGLEYKPGSGPGFEPTSEPRSKPGSEPGSGLESDEAPSRTGPTLGPGSRLGSEHGSVLGSGLRPRSGLGSRVSVRSDGSLVLRRSELEDSGRYFCSISQMNDREKGRERWKRGREEKEGEREERE